jgi:predicted PurR-regulated permease PerM
MLVVSMIYGVGTASVMLATGLPAALPAAIISSLLLAVPFIGDWLALALPLLIAIVAGDFITFIIVLAVLLFVQQVMLNLLTPRILGHAVRMPAMLVIISVVLGARLAGVPGALLGVPTAGVLYTLGVHYGTRVRQRREARDAIEREKRDAIEREGFAEEVERALEGHTEDAQPPAA